MRLYKKLYNMRQICNIAVYMLHSACTIHLLNLPEKTAKRDIIHGVKHLEEIAEDWLCARRTLSILSVLARKWKCELPDEAAAVLKRTDDKYGHLGTAEVPSPASFTQSPAPQMQHIPDDFLSTVGGPMAANAPTSLAQEPMPHNAWAMPGIGQPVMPRYYQHPFAPMAPPPSSAGGSRNRPSYTLDGKDWFLKDSVNLQQNFESWGMAPTGSSSNPTNTLPGGGVFMFKGLQNSDMDMDMGDGWNFDSSMTNLDLIPGLD